MTQKQRLFCDLYIANGFKAKQAYLEAYGSRENNDPSYPYTLLAKQEIKDYIEEKRNKLYSSLNIDAIRVMEETAKIAFGNDSSVPIGVKLKALELLSKNLNLQTLKTENKDVIEVQLVEE